MFTPAHPGEVLKHDILAATGLTVAKAAEVLGVGRPALSAVLNCCVRRSKSGGRRSK